MKKLIRINSRRIAYFIFSAISFPSRDKLSYRHIYEGGEENMNGF